MPPFHTQQVGGARHIDIQKGAPHQEVRSLGGDVLGQLRQPLGRDHPRQPALAAPAHQVRHGPQGQLARLIRHVPRDGRGKQLRLIHHHQHRIPMVAVDVENAAQKRRRPAQLVLRIQPLQIQHGGNAVHPSALPG
ncbi:hypothetical protein GALL_528870 [mine drainage metagenome]|uniref:Uncharacterized protein n=1 Tax=mine drainage metagenome TaxID=410659 RepID=A0A1J5P4B5_9ZZZZ